MRKIFISFVIGGAIVQLFFLIMAYKSECKHIYVAVEQSETNVDFGFISLGNWRIGKQEGKEIVCVKCYHVRKQIVDYGGDGDLLKLFRVDTATFRNLIITKDNNSK